MTAHFIDQTAVAARDLTQTPVRIGEFAAQGIPTPPIRAAAPDDAAAVIDLVTVAFSADPVLRWVWPRAQDYLMQMPHMVRAFAGSAFDHGSAYCVEGFLGAALWLPPDAHPDEAAMVTLLQTTTPEHRHAELFAVLEQMGVFHPQAPHWYLPLIGVDPAHQGKGLGSELMRHALAICDQQGLPAYLESSNPRNIPLYLRLGFDVIGTIQVGSSPEIVPMLRTAR